MCSAVSGHLGPSAVTVDGRLEGERGQEQLRDRIDTDVSTAIEEERCAQVVFDNYGHAIRRSQGGKLHSMLYRLLVDSLPARDTGALLVARFSDTLDPGFSGSPLLSRAHVETLPALTEEDAQELQPGTDLTELKELVGESTWLARRFLGADARQGRLRAIEHLNNDSRRIAATLPSSAAEVLLGTRRLADCDPNSLEALRCLGTLGHDGEFKLSRLVEDSQLLSKVRSESPGWPSTRESSIRRFAELLSDSDRAMWVDRYLFANADEVGSFLKDLRQVSKTALRLLVSDDPCREGFAQEISDAVQGLPDVEVRFMSRSDRRRLHDRHLVFPTTKSGVVIPTAGVILGIDDPGSAVSVPMPSLAVNYTEFWARGDRVFPNDL
ncbi:hypothetical protein [Gulosibacter sediminis]|uniref:hypothetical protein n=1 Tax=Gulosibacter sediminis TaxID=1729695 RepID=UPI001B7D7E15|nr:hypothetical protein [Gulosibacter sediminis]